MLRTDILNPHFICPFLTLLLIFWLQIARMAEEVALEHRDEIGGRRVVARRDLEQWPPLHLDRGADFLKNSDDWRNHKVSEYYGIFVDLWLLGDASCVTVGKGHYGKWGRALSRNVSCFADYNKGIGCPSL